MESLSYMLFFPSYLTLFTVSSRIYLYIRKTTIIIITLFFWIGTSGSIVVCISPLTSLMLDQRAKYSPRGLLVEFVSDEQSHCDKEGILRGEVQLLFISPERALLNPTYRNMFLSKPYKEKLVGLVVDEAHCVKTWGDEFRTAFSQIGEMRSLIPTGVNIMALTATATTDTLRIVSNRLCMVNPVIIALPPYRDNITYQLWAKVDLDRFTDSLCSDLASKRLRFPKTIIYVRTYANCINMYMAIKAKIGEGFTEPPGYPNLAEYRTIDMFTRVLTTAKKEEVMTLFSKIGGKLRLVIATTAFGMGVDVADIQQIIHWGMPSTLEEYVQEAGRSGRDGRKSVAIVYKGNCAKNASPLVREYETNISICRRRLLFRGFLMYSESDIKAVGCVCCDVCGNSCQCTLCKCV